MNTPDQEAASLVTIDPEAAADLLDVLDDLAAWCLVPARWERVEHLLEQITAALTVMDISAVRAATAELELASPPRVHRITASEVAPVSETTKDRANHLVHLVRTGQAAATRSGSAAAERQERR